MENLLQVKLSFFSSILRFNEFVDVRIRTEDFVNFMYRSLSQNNISRTDKNTCPVTCLENYIKVANISEADEFLFRAKQFFGKIDIV